MITIYTDGCCKNNKDGGWAAIISSNRQVLLIGGHVSKTTNNQMELMGPIQALTHIYCEHEKIKIFSDSEYFVKGFNEWMDNWAAKNWMTRGKHTAKNLEHWQQLYNLKECFPGIVGAKWVKGHSGEELNEICDEVANVCCAKKININFDYSSLTALKLNYARSIGVV